MAPTDSTDRRRCQHGPARGRRWTDNPYQCELFDWAKQDVGARLFAMREGQGWSLEKVAALAGMRAETVADLENGRGDPKLSTITRLLAVYGYYTRVLPERPSNLAPGCRGVNRAARAASA